jgi:integrase
MARHGFRVSEAIDLEWDQIDFTRAHIGARASDETACHLFDSFPKQRKLLIALRLSNTTLRYCLGELLPDHFGLDSR